MRGNVDNPCSHSVGFTEGYLKKAVSCDKHCIYPRESRRKGVITTKTKKYTEADIRLNLGEVQPTFLKFGGN